MQQRRAQSANNTLDLPIKFTKIVDDAEVASDYDEYDNENLVFDRIYRNFLYIYRTIHFIKSRITMDRIYRVMKTIWN